MSASLSSNKLIWSDVDSAGISQALLARARSLTNEHSTLSAHLAEVFDAKLAKRVGELAPIASTLKEWEHANSVWFSPMCLCTELY